MNEQDRDWMIERYTARYREFGVDIRTLGSGTEARRRIRFGVLADIGIDDGCSVLDVGCGFGDFFAYLEAAGRRVRYVGLDINQTLVNDARQRHPGAEFRVGDLQHAALEPFDFVVASGTFNLRMRTVDNYDYVTDVLRVAYGIARRGVAIDLLSSYVDFSQPDVFHYEPERLFAIAKALTKRVCLRHDYPLYEFCLYLYPDFPRWGTPAGQGSQHEP